MLLEITQISHLLTAGQDILRILFFPNVITEWNKLDMNIKNMTSYTAFKNALLSFIRPKLIHFESKIPLECNC